MRRTLTNYSFSYKQKTKYLSNPEDILFSLDASPDFHDPFSDLNLFLSNQIKQEMRSCGHPKKWSHSLEEHLIKKIAPSFHKRFPQYKLGIATLKKTWEKFIYYAEQIQEKKEAISQDGKLNLHFLIKEYIKNSCVRHHASSLPPYHHTHQIAVKISECIATIDGTRPQLDLLAKTIWAVHRNLLTHTAQGKSPYEDYDKVDQLIVKKITQITTQDPFITWQNLELKIKEDLISLKELSPFSSLDAVTCNIAVLLADKFYPTCSVHTRFSSEENGAIRSFMHRQIKLCRTSLPSLSYPQLVRRVIALYTLAVQLPRDLNTSDMRLAIQSVYPTAQKERPLLPQSIYAFIAAESVLMKNDEYCHSVDHVVETIHSAYLETNKLPILQKQEEFLLEIFIWKLLDETEHFLERLPYQIGKKIEEEIGATLIENPTQDFSSILHNTAQFFKKTRELTSKKWQDIERKIHNWAIQSDMAYKWMHIEKGELLSLVHKDLPTEHICQEYLKKHPLLALYTPQLLSHITSLRKHIWYNQATQPGQSSFDRFILWHASKLSYLDTGPLLEKLEEICHKSAPLFPFDKDHTLSLLNKMSKTALYPQPPHLPTPI